MEKNSDTYMCEKCGNILLKSNKMLHDLKCTSFNGGFDFFGGGNHTNNNFISINEIDTYTCNKCGACINLKDKVDHLLCHQIEEDNKENEITEFRNNQIISDSSSEEGDKQNVINNININIINNNNGIHKTYRIGGNLNNSDDDEDYNDKNNSNENDELEDNEEQEEFDSFEEDDFSDENNGIDENTIKTFPVSKIKDISKLTEEKKKCCICLENFKKNDETMILPCIHIFHSDCIKKWMKRQDICPICKNKIIGNNM